MCQPDELLDHVQRWTRSVVENHVQMVDTESCEVCGRVEFRIQTDHESYITLREVGEYILERAWQVGLLNVGGVGRQGRI